MLESCYGKKGYNEVVISWSDIPSMRQKISMMVFWATAAKLLFSLVWFNGISTIVGYIMPNPVFTYILSIWFVNLFYKCTLINDQTVLFLTIQFSIRHLFALSLPYISHSWPIGLSGATTPGQSGLGSDGKEGVLHIPQSSSITRHSV